MDLKKKLAAFKPVHDSKTTWLRDHRPSVALLLCLMSGPWRFPRRKLMQERALKILGKRDLIDLTVQDIQAMSPLDWQYKLLTAYVRYFQACNRKEFLLQHPAFPQHPYTFDKVFDVHHGHLRNEDLLRWFLDPFRFYKAKPYILREEEYEKLFFQLPKVLGMFVRDYLYIDSFPIDRHVRKTLKELGLPTKAKDLLNLFKAHKMKARYYARALFLNASSNPKHPSTRRR